MPHEKEVSRVAKVWIELCKGAARSEHRSEASREPWASSLHDAQSCDISGWSSLSLLRFLRRGFRCSYGRVWSGQREVAA